MCAPISWTTPAMSYPGISGRCVPNSFAYLPLSVSGSAGLTPLAITRTSASSSFGSGRGTCSSLSTSGAPYSCATTARIIGFSSARAVQTDRTPSAVKLKNRRVRRLKCMRSRSRAIKCRANWKFCGAQRGERYLLPRINKDLPALHVLQFQNAVREPGIVLQFFSHFVLIFRVNDQERAMRQSGCIDQRAAHENETFINEFIDKGCVFVPQWLLTRSL